MDGWTDGQHEWMDGWMRTHTKNNTSTPWLMTHAANKTTVDIHAQLFSSQQRQQYNGHSAATFIY